MASRGRSFPRVKFAQLPAVQLTPYLPSVHGVDVLLDLWAIAARRGEHIQAFGPVAASPQGFVTNYVQQADMMVLHRDGGAVVPANIFALAWCDDIFFPARARVHGFVSPVARSGALVLEMARMVFAHLFDVRGFHLLYEIIPVTYKPSLRVVKACGFERRTILENGAMDQTGPVDGVVMVLTRKRWLEGGLLCRGSRHLQEEQEAQQLVQVQQQEPPVLVRLPQELEQQLVQVQQQEPPVRRAQDSELGPQVQQVLAQERDLARQGQGQGQDSERPGLD